HGRGPDWEPSAAERPGSPLRRREAAFASGKTVRHRHTRGCRRPKNRSSLRSERTRFACALLGGPRPCTASYMPQRKECVTVRAASRGSLPKCDRVGTPTPTAPLLFSDFVHRT